MDLLIFPLYNKDTCSLLLRIPSSTNYDCFKRNAQRAKWLIQLLILDAQGKEQVKEGVTWLLWYLGVVYNDSFIAVACNLSLLLAPKGMDAESACTVCEKENCPM
jgi:hypothetical protein